ncbi:MAG TPA: hypothetical protein VKE40_00590 [Gemmataceae bacterium]|nr:hypothetical protein [Gemmataceae bacterium]
MSADHVAPELDVPNDTPMAWEGRVFAVALVWAVPGILLGALVEVVLSALGTMSNAPVILGGVAGLLAGGWLESGDG